MFQKLAIQILLTMPYKLLLITFAFSGLKIDA